MFMYAWTACIDYATFVTTQSQSYTQLPTDILAVIKVIYILYIITNSLFQATAGELGQFLR